MNDKNYSSENIDYSLKRPCNDCPFKKKAKYHEGVLQALPNYHAGMEMGNFGHSCHKTDPRSDGFNEGFKGKAKHCMGAIALMAKDKDIQPQGHIVRAHLEGKIKVKDVEASKKQVFDSFIDMLKHYMKLSPHKEFKNIGDRNAIKNIN